MLVLSRKPGEAINLGKDIKICIISIDADRVKIGIEAPLELKILRAELLEEVKSVNIEAINAKIFSLELFK